MMTAATSSSWILATGLNVLIVGSIMVLFWALVAVLLAWIMWGKTDEEIKKMYD